MDRNIMAVKDSEGQPALPKHLIGASTMVPRKLFFQIDGFDESVSSGEDTDLHDRLKAKKTPILIDHVLDVTHLGNAKTPWQFIQRQIWHSENYLTNFKKSFSDPIFIITIFFLISFVILLTQIFYGSLNVKKEIILPLYILLPALLSLKRMHRAGHLTLQPNLLIKIYILDLFYLTGRSIGTLKGLTKIRTKKS